MAFVGPSGCGKSTLSKLISGLYQPWTGEILFDGKSISSIDHSIFTGSVAVVERGTHDELYAKGGAYTTLVASE